MAKTKDEQKKQKTEEKHSAFSPRMIAQIAEEVAKRLPHPKKKPNKPKKNGNGKVPVFLDTSAIIDGRIFEVINLKIFDGKFFLLDSILSELKHIADSNDTVKKERGRRGLDLLDKLKKTKGFKVEVLSEDQEKSLKLDKYKEVDEKLIRGCKAMKGKIITCDYNLEKKSNINGVTAINVNTLANLLKVTAIPGESFSIKLQHIGKDVTQGVGYFDDGTMVVVENSSTDIGKEVDVVVSRVIQTTAGRILFAKKIF